MKTIEKLALYRARLEAYKASKAIGTPGITEPKPEGYGLKTTAEKFMAAKTREEILGK